MLWYPMDVRQMDELESNSFDLVVDKAMLDTLLCCDNSLIKVAQMLKES